MVNRSWEQREAREHIVMLGEERSCMVDRSWEQREVVHMVDRSWEEEVGSR